MKLRAVYFDNGGVIVRTEFQAPRQHLAERLGLEYEDLVRQVFESESAKQAAVGQITEDEHWAAVMRALHLDSSKTQAFREEFFAGDVTDLALLATMRGLRRKVKVGLISNAWSGLRPWIIKRKYGDAFDAMIISAEVGLAKPDPRIYQLALEKLGVEAPESVFLDDFLENVEAARAVGMQAIHFTRTEQALQELKSLLANHQ